jgi:hypothetical protein
MVISCTQTPENQTTELLLQKLDSMDRKIDSLQAKLQPINDTATITPKTKVVKDSVPTTKKKLVLPKKRDSIKAIVLPPKPTKEIYYFTKSQKPSLIIEPWTEGKRKLLFYNHNGELTYTQEDVHMSYSISSTVKGFHSNGAVNAIEIHINPGASMYMYQSDITFDEDNIPLWKKDSQWPSRLEDYMKPPYYWDRKEKIWKQQEIVIEQPVPTQ